MKTAVALLLVAAAGAGVLAWRVAHPAHTGPAHLNRSVLEWPSAPPRTAP